MIESIKVTNYRNESITLPMRDPEQSGFFIGGINGLDPTKGTINVTENLSIDGAFYNSARATYRNIVIFLGFNDANGTTIEEIRHEAYRYFPVKRKVKLEITTTARVLYAEGYVESTEVNIFSKRQIASVSILCPDAYLRALAPIDTVFSGINPLFEFPFENESATVPTLEFGEYLLSQQKNLLYDGDATIGIVVTALMKGTVEDFRIYNLTTQQQMHFDDTKISAILGSSLANGDQIIVSTVIGDKYVKVIRSGVTYNVLNALNANAVGHAWITIEPGDNVFYITADVGGTLIQSHIQHHPAYLGV